MSTYNAHTAFKLSFRFDVQKLEHDLSTALQYNWQKHYNGSDYSGDWTIIALRSENGQEETVTARDSSSYQNTALLSECLYFTEVLAQFKCEKQAIRLMQLAPQSSIKEHRDNSMGYEDGIFRIHIPITTNPNVSFYVDGNLLPMQCGECWYANFNLPHRVENLGHEPRVHLVIDCLRNDWSDQLFAKNGFDLSVFTRDKTRLEDIPMVIKQLELMNTDRAREMIVEMRKRIER